MSGGNRAYTLQDVLGQLNQDSAQGQTDDSATLQINQLSGVFDTVQAADAVTTATGGVSFNWDAGFHWGAVGWGAFIDGGGASSAFSGTAIDGGTATSTYPTTGNFDGGAANG